MSEWGNLLDELNEHEPSFALLQTALGKAPQRPSPSEPSKRRRRARRLVVGSAAALGAVVLVVVMAIAAHSRRDEAPAAQVPPDRTDSSFAYMRYRPDRADSPATNTLMLATATGTRRLLTIHGHHRFIAHTSTSPDGRNVALLVGQDNGHGSFSNDLEVVSTRAGRAHRAPRVIPAVGDAGMPIWSPDSSALAFGVLHLGAAAETTSLYTFSLDGASQRPVRVYTSKTGAVISGASWSPDGRTIAFTLDTPINPALSGSGTYREQSMLLDVASRAVHPLPASLTGRFATGVFPHRLVGPIFQPHGDLIAAYSIQPYLTSATSSRVTPIKHRFQYGAVPLGWSPDGRYLLLSANPKAPTAFPPKYFPPEYDPLVCHELFTYDVKTHGTVRIGCGQHAEWEPLTNRVVISTRTDTTATDPNVAARSAITLTSVSALGTDQRVLTRNASPDH
jgi:dipeptidyl aminopeptidase/acylaminoacyl peptidase